jgi:hypothetical protein
MEIGKGFDFVYERLVIVSHKFSRKMSGLAEKAIGSSYCIIHNFTLGLLIIC